MTLEQSDKVLEKKYLPKRPIEDVIEIVSQSLCISESMICSGSRLKNISNARALISYIASEIVGHSLSDVARVLGVKRVSVREAVPKGKIIISNYPLLMSDIK